MFDLHLISEMGNRRCRGGWTASRKASWKFTCVYTLCLIHARINIFIQIRMVHIIAISLNGFNFSSSDKVLLSLVHLIEIQERKRSTTNCRCPTCRL